MRKNQVEVNALKSTLTQILKDEVHRGRLPVLRYAKFSKHREPKSFPCLIRIDYVSIHNDVSFYMSTIESEDINKLKKWYNKEMTVKHSSKVYQLASGLDVLERNF